MLDIITDALIDTLKLIPFLFLSFIIMELLEHKINIENKLTKINKFGPLAGTILGIIPQCGFGTLASNLYAARVITLGTLMAIFLTTSDEMIPIMISHQENASVILNILLYKALIGLFVGILIDIIYHKKENDIITDLCKQDDCHCKESGVLKSSLIHTLKISLFILIINIIISYLLENGLVIESVKNNKILTPIITSLIGLIPNCAASVIITELYLNKVITFGSLLSGLLSGSGVALLVLFKQNKHILENIIILLLLIVIASVFGIIFNII